MVKSFKLVKTDYGFEKVVGFFNLSDEVWVTPIHISFSRSRKTETHVYALDDSKEYLKITWQNNGVIKAIKIVAGVLYEKATIKDLGKINNSIDKELYLGKTPDILIGKLIESGVKVKIMRK